MCRDASVRCCRNFGRNWRGLRETRWRTDILGRLHHAALQNAPPRGREFSRRSGNLRAEVVRPGRWTMRSSWSSFCPTITRTAPRRARPRGGRVHRGVALSRTASTKERAASTDSELLRAYPYIWAYKRSCSTSRWSSRTSLRVLRGTGANLPSTPRSLK